MANVGNCLLFYLKYPAEMERLYEADEPKAEGLPDADRTLEKVKLVGDAADKEAAELLEACVPAIEERFRAISEVKQVRSNLEKTWQVRFRIAPKNTTPDGRIEIGVNINHYRAALIPWVWCRGGRRSEDEVVRVLGRGIKSATLEYHAGTLGLAEIEIPIPERLEEPVASDSLIAQVQQAFAPFTEQHVKSMTAIANNRET